MPGRRILHLGPSIALAVLGFSIVLVTQSVEPGPRISRRDRLVDLIAREDARARSLRAQLEDLQRRLTSIEAGATARRRSAAGLERSLVALRRQAGLAPVEGPGVSVELRDSSLRESPTGDPNDLVIHEQDLQAVVNGLWRAGAEAMAINGERVTGASAVRCVGNTLLLHGSVYSPPYRVEAIGDPERLAAAMRGDDPLVQRFRIFAEEFRLGFDVDLSPMLSLPAFGGAPGIAAHFARAR